MPVDEVVHASSFLDHSGPRHFRRQSSQSSNKLFYDAPLNQSIDASLTDSASPPRGPLRTATFPLRDLPDPHQESGRASPDPHEFYRHYPRSVKAENAVGEQNPGRDSNNSTTRPSQFQRIASLPTYDALNSSSRTNWGPQNRSASDTSCRRAGLNGTKTTPNKPVSTARSRQVSFKDLINKFESTSDQVLPMPSRAQDKSTPASPASSPTATKFPPIPQYDTDKASPRNDDGDTVAFAGTDNEASGKAQASVDSKPNPPSRRPLRFGERLSVDTSVHDPVSGIPPHMRRGSEGSIPSPNPATLDQFDFPSGRSPLTPTAWYLGQTPFLEAVDPNADTNRTHRRTRSDFPGRSSVSLATSKLGQSSSHIAAPATPLQQPQPQTQPQTQPPESPHSRSRIPISSRHLSSASVSDASPPRAALSTTFNSRSAAQISLPPKGISRLPKPSSPPESPPGMTDDDGPEPFATGRVRQQRSGRNPPLQAYIAAPPPQKLAPPLRSSRPHKPVSNATSPTGPGSKVVERVSNIQRQINRDRELRTSRRERKLPELGHVDFATRRQRIQQAFNRTVQENERKEEEAAELRRRASKTEEENPDDGHPPSNGQSEQQNLVDSVPSPTTDAATVIDDQIETCHDEHQPEPSEQRHLTGNNNHSNQPAISVSETPRSLPHLHIDTHLPPLPELPDCTTTTHPMTMDSPTLGLPMVAGRNATIPRSEPKSSLLQPMSAVTLESTDTHVTMLDPEPQSGLGHPPQLDTPHRTLLTQIMQFRESSPSDSSCDEPDYSLSDNDDKESIPIMLRGTACFEESVNDSDNQDTCDASDNSQDQVADEHEPPSNRWSTSSWSSSLRDQHFAEARYEHGSGEDLCHVAPSADDSEVTTQSCSASSSTPPSVIGHQFTVASPQPASEAPEPKSERTSTRSTLGFSSAPSLARLGGWDSKRVTQLYFEELARGRGPNLSVPGTRASPEPRRSDLTYQRSDGRADSLTDDPVLVSSFHDVPESEPTRNSATLLFRDDWEHASPSIADWMQVAADSDSSEGERKARGQRHDAAPTPRHNGSKTESSGADEPGNSLGLAINVQAPQEHNSSEVQSSEHQDPQVAAPPETTPKETTTKQPPPLPPQARTSSNAPTRQVLPQQPRPASHVPTQSGTFTPLGLVQSTGSSESSSLQNIETTSSLRAHAVGSSVTSLAPSHSEPTSLDLKRPSPSPEQLRLKKRRHVIKEMVDTEYTFGRDMKVVDDIYKGTSSSCLDLSTDDVKILFGNSDQVVQFSMAFQDTLKRAAKSVYVMPKSQRWSTKRRNRQLNGSNDEPSFLPGTEASDMEKDRATFLGQAFMAHMAQMEKVYADYLKNHDAANKKLQTLQKNPKVAIWLKECRDWASDLTSAWDLDSLLVKPVQRILKYPLLLTELLESTPADHPDHASLVNALEEVTNISVRINEMKKRADLVGQVVGRKRNQSDVRAGLSKAFGRRTGKLRQQVGVADMFEDKEYASLSQRFGDSYFQLQVVMRDVESYTQEAQGSMDRFNEFVIAIESFVDVAQSNYPELEQRWRQLKAVVRDIMTVALPEHVSASSFNKLKESIANRY